MKELGYYNGKYGELNEMTVPMNDRACWFGDGVYEAGMCRNYHIFAIDRRPDGLLPGHARRRAARTLLPGRPGQPLGHTAAQGTGSYASACITDHGRGYAFSPLQYQDAEPDPLRYGQ